MDVTEIHLRWCALRFARLSPDIPPVVVDWLNTGDAELRKLAVFASELALHSQEPAHFSWRYVSDAIWGVVNYDGSYSSEAESLRRSAEAVVAVKEDSRPHRFSKEEEEWDMEVACEQAAQNWALKHAKVAKNLFEMYGLGALRYPSVEAVPWIAGQIYKALDLPNQDVVADRVNWFVAQGK